MATLLKKIPQQDRSKKRLAAIIAAAEKIAVEQDIDQATTSMIAARAGVAIGSIYQFFEDRDALLEYVYIQTLDRIVTEQQAFAGAGFDRWQDFISENLRHFWRLAQNHPSFLIFTRWYNATRPLKETIAPLDSPLGRFLQQVVSGGDFDFPAERRDVILTLITASLSIGIDLAFEEKDQTKAVLIIEALIDQTITSLSPFEKAKAL